MILKSILTSSPHRVFLIVFFYFGSFLFSNQCHAQLPGGDWYKGDLHAHSDYSDGDSTVSALIKNAEDKGFDFFTITDHDTSLGGDPVHWVDPGYHSDKLVLLYGIEWTTARGHANVWSHAPFSYTDLWQANRAKDGVAAAAAAAAQGALFSPNHPSSLFTSSWHYLISPYVSCIEVWNTMYRFPSGNRRAEFCFWDSMLRDGLRMPGVGGSDTHHLTGWMPRLYGLGNPTTWIYAPERAAEALLAGIRDGHVSISYAPDAPRLDFSADINSDGTDDVMMGDNVPETGHDTLFSVRLAGSDQSSLISPDWITAIEPLPASMTAEGLLSMKELLAASPETGSVQLLFGVCVYKNGVLFKAWIVPAGSFALSFSDRPSTGTYYRVELIGTPDATIVQHLLYGRVLALTNPIYFGFQE
jgi:hypothetical protein